MSEHAQYFPRSQMINLPTGRFHYLSWGAERTELPAIVLLHGVTSSVKSWIRVGPALADRYRVYALDMRGHGESVKPAPGVYSLRHTADDALAFIETLELERPGVIGHSWGGATAIVLASGAWSTEPAPVLSHLVLEDPAHRSAQGDPALAVAPYIKDIGRPADELRAEFAQASPSWAAVDTEGKIEALQQVSRETVISIFADLAKVGELFTLLSRIEAPTLLLRADPNRGSIIGEAAWELAQQQLSPGSRAVQIDEADHSIHRSQFAAFMQVVDDFLSVDAGIG